MDNQTAFEKSAKHILGQRRVCEVKNEGGDVRCVYAGPDGQACAVGCLLPRRIAKKLDASMVGSWGFDSVNSVEAQEYLKGVSTGLLRELQEIHDIRRGGGGRATHRNQADKKQIRKELINLGREFQLDTQFLEA